MTIQASHEPHPTFTPHVDKWEQHDNFEDFGIDGGAFSWSL